MQQPPYGPPPHQQQGYGPPPGPGYGYGPPQPPPPKKGMGAGTIVLIVIGCMFGGCVVLGAIGAATSKQQPTAVASEPNAPRELNAARPAAVAPPERVKPQPATSVSAAELFAAYQANEIAADDQFKGKKLRVTGTVSEIAKGPFGGLSLHLATSNQFMPIDADMEDSEKPKLAQLSKGTKTALLCTGEGMIIGRPHLADCTIE